MADLSRLRETIDQIDGQIRELYLKRMRMVDEVAQIKEKTKEPILDVNREAEIVFKLTEAFPDQRILPYYRRVLQTILETSKDFQQELGTRCES
jgi:monofunctional chorismate mutase